jgi:hypothetical protein
MFFVAEVIARSSHRRERRLGAVFSWQDPRLVRAGI